jgi:antitoxin (DNA-binding transcriptional repressor) of toxin-antitoxin stability system
MNVSIVELRYKTKEVLKAVERGEQVVVVARGREKGVISRRASGPLTSAAQHPFFNSAKTRRRSVDAVMAELRGGRFRAL